MHKDWFTLIEKYTIPGARERFESICGTLFKKTHSNENTRNVEVKQGDDGIDIFIGNIGINPIHVIQCKFFPKEFESSQKQQIRNSFKTSIENKGYKMHNWTLCIVNRFNNEQHKWWAAWKDKMTKLYELNEDFIALIDGDDLIDLFNETGLYNTVFEKEDSIKIEEIHKNLIPKISLHQLEKTIQNASSFLNMVKNYFEKDPTTHIERRETKDIIDWIKADLQPTKKNILILEGEKGLGKSVILKDVYEILKNEGYLVLGIKADKYYASSPRELENKLFLNGNITFSNILETINENKKQLIVIIDQLDALSQTLSSNREYIQTYNRIINELVDEVNVRVIISSRSYDLQYDAELSIYKSNYYINIKTTLLRELEVRNTLNKFHVSCSIKKVIELLRTPNHLEIFCKLPNKNKVNLNALSSLKDLYDVLWNSLIDNQKELMLDKVLYEIADEMYKQQQIVINKQFVSKFNSEINYLLSNQLLTIEDYNIQFFHQTFYDYCYSRQFVENGHDIYFYLNQNQQNLEIRSIIKMVFEYLREYDPKKYIINTKNILKSSKYRFHIKSLIIINLGLVTPTNDEKELFQSHIFKNKLYEDVFINSVFSEKWIEYFIQNKVADQYLFIEKRYKFFLYDFYKKQSFFKSQYFESLNYNKLIEDKKNAIWVLFRNNINKSPHQIISYISQLPDFPNKHGFIERILYNLDNWEDERMLTYFEQYITFNEEVTARDNFWFYQILEKIFEHHSNYTFERIQPIIINRFNKSDSWNSVDFSHDQEDLLNKMYGLAPEKSFLFLINLYEEIINNHKETKCFEIVDCPYYGCEKFYDGRSVSKEGHVFIQEFLLKHLLSKKEDKNYILNFYQKYKNSNSINLLKLIVLFFRESKQNYFNEIFELLNIIYSKNGLNGSDDNFQLYLRQLIGDTFELFSNERKMSIAEILLTVKYPYDLKGRKYKDSDGIEKVYFTGYGIKQYLFLSLLPQNEINKNIRLKKTFQEFKRRFGKVEANKARDVSSGGAYMVGAPLEHDAYINMNFKSWKSSILKFDDNYVENHGPKGGKLEHSRAFSDTVKQNPDKFYDFILDLFEDENVSKTYISSGINGLIEGKYNPNKVQILCKKLINLNLDRTITLYTIWQTGYLIEHKKIDIKILKFLSKSALEHPHPDKPLNENDPLSDSLNSVRGAAIHKIIKCFEHREFSELIFETIEKAANDSQISVRVAIISEIAFLNHLDIERSYKIFDKLVEGDNIQILENSIRASKYFNNKYHSEMLPYFHKIINYKELNKHGEVIVLSWLIDEINDKKLFNQFIKSSKEAKLCALRVAEANLINNGGTVNEKSLEIIKKLLKQTSKEFSSAYSGLILRKIKNKNFKQFYPFLDLYSKTNLCLNEPRYFLQLLLKCVKDYPLDCLHLVENMNFNKAPDIQESGYYTEEPVQLILSIYSKLNMDLKNNRKQVKKSLDIFDSMLKINHLRITANKAIELTV